MPGPLHAPPLIILYPFRFRDPVSGKSVKARYVAERHEIEARHAEWEVIGEPEIRRRGDSGHFNPWRPKAGRSFEPDAGIDGSPALRDTERPLVLLFLRRYVAYCARCRRFAQMEGAARLFHEIVRP